MTQSPQNPFDQPREQKIDVRGLSISYKIFGSQDASNVVLMLHGWGARKELFDISAQHLARHANARVVTLDFPGFGASETPTDVWGSEQFAAFVLEFLTLLKIDSVSMMVGHSHGGRVSIFLSAHHPEVVKKLLLIDSAGIKPKRKLKYHIRVKAFKAAKYLVLHLLRSSRLRRKAMAKLYRLFGSSDYRAAGAMRQTLVKVVNEDHSHLLSKIHCPTLLVWGDQDTDTPLWMAKKMEQEIKDCGLVVFSGAGHYSFLDRSQQFCLVAAKFLEG